MSGSFEFYFKVQLFRGREKSAMAEIDCTFTNWPKLGTLPRTVLPAVSL